MLNPDKFQFGQRTVDFAGFRISESSIEPLPKYLDAIRDFPTPLLPLTYVAGSGWSIRSPTMPSYATPWLPLSPF